MARSLLGALLTIATLASGCQCGLETPNCLDGWCVPDSSFVMNERCDCNSRKSETRQAKCTCFSCGASIFACISCTYCYRQNSDCGPSAYDCYVPGCYGATGCYGVYQHKQKMSHALWGQIHTDVSARLTAIQDGKTIASGGCGHGAGNTCTSNHRMGGYQRYLENEEVKLSRGIVRQ